MVVAPGETAPPGEVARPGVLNLHWSEIADAVWLARHQERAGDAGGAVPAGAERHHEPHRDVADEPRPPPPDPARDERLRSPDEPHGAESGPTALVALAGGSRAGPGADLTGWPAVPALAGAAAIGRALRPLKQTVPSRHDLLPDETATAERAVEDQLWLPVLRRAQERRWDVVLVVDASPTMVVWQRTIDEFAALVQQLGAFRNVQVRRLDTAATDPTAMSVRGTGSTALPRAPSEVLDPTGRRVVLVLTDGAAPGWHTGAALAVLRSWGEVLPVALVHLLPQQLWHQTGIHAHRVRLHAPSIGAASARHQWRSRDPGAHLTTRLGGPAASGVGAIPVLELGARWMAPWARLVAGLRGGWANLMVALPTGWPGAPRPPTDEAEPPPDGPGEPATASERVFQFRANSSPVAFELATHLAAAPLNLPVARLVQALLLPRSRPWHLSEVVNSGLLRTSDGAEQLAAVDRVSLEFHDGVREELLSFGRRADTARVVRIVDDYLGPVVEAVRGQSRVLVDPDDHVARTVTPETEPFVRVEAAVLQALSGPQLARSRQLTEALKGLAAAATGSPPPSQDQQQDPAEVPMTTTPAQQPSPGLATDPLPKQPGHPGPASPAPGTDGADTGSGGGSKPRSTPVQPTVWGSIPPRNPNFTGRTELLAALHERLRVGTTAVLPEALHGMGGVGKSQLAVEYVYRHATDYDLIWWIPAERPAQIGQALSELAQRLSLRVGAEVNAAVPAVREALRVGHPFRNWLLVFDNAESPEAVRPFFPSGGPGCILVTSRDGQWRSIARTLEVNVFTREESTELLSRRGPELSPQDADRLAVALGDLPLAIEQAAAWRAETGMPADEYLRLLEEKRPELLDDARPLDYPTTVAAAWNVSLDALRERNLGALRLLQLCAFLAPEPISRSLFTGARGTQINQELDETLRDPIQFGRAIREINRYALARIDHRTNSIQMHRLVQRVLAAQMTEQERETMTHGAHLLLAASDPNQPDTAAHWPRYGELYSHVIASGAIRCDDGWVRQLVLNEAKYLWRWGDSRGGRDLSKLAYDEWKRELGADDPETLKMARWLGFMLFVVGQYDEAAELNAGTLEAFRNQLGEDHEDTLEAMQAVAADRRVQGRFDIALDISDQVYQRSVRMFGVDDPITLRAAHNLAVSLRLSSEFQRAKELDLDTSQRNLQILGDDHPDSLYTRLGLIIDQRELGEYQAARAALEELVNRHRLLLGEDNFFTLRAVRTLSVTRRKAGDHEGALACAEEARERFLSQFGEDYPETMAATLDLSTDRRQNGQLRSARELGTITHQRYVGTFGEDHPHSVCAAVNVATTLRLMNDITEAYAIDHAGYDKLQAALGDDHVLALSCSINLASDQFLRGEVGPARRRDAETLERLRVRFGEEHPITLACAINLAIDLRGLGRLDEGLALHSETIGQFERVLGPDHPATRDAARWSRANCDMYPMPL